MQFVHLVDRPLYARLEAMNKTCQELAEVESIVHRCYQGAK
jgi:hypothetical protein